MRQKVELYGRFKSHYSSTLDLQQENQNDTNGLNQTQMLWCDLKQTVQAGNPQYWIAVIAYKSGTTFSTQAQVCFFP